MLRCPNCFLVLELMRDRRNTMVAARITASVPERTESACDGRGTMQDEGHFLREPGSRRMVRVEERLFHRKARSAGIRAGTKTRGFRVGHNPGEVRECEDPWTRRTVGASGGSPRTVRSARSTGGG